MNQPYIFKKQIVSLLLFVITIIIFNLVSIPNFVIKTTYFYLFFIISITFTPSLRKYINYPVILHSCIYYFPLVLPIIFLHITMKHYDVRTSIILGTLTGALLILSNYRHNINFISSKNYLTLSPITIPEFFNDFFTDSLSIISEEIFFRLFLVGYLANKIGPLAILISSLLFVFSHFLNRWANVTFTFKSYLYQFILGLLLGYIFYLTGSILGTIISHFIFNSPSFIVLYKRFKKRNEKPIELFNDYE